MSSKLENLAARIETFLATNCNPHYSPADELLQEAVNLLRAHQAGGGHHPDTTQVAVVDDGYYWREIDQHTPRGAKMQLINRRLGCATYGTIGSSERNFTHWAPLPKFRK